MPGKSLVLVDSSVWIDYFRQGPKAIVVTLDTLLEAGEVAVSGLVYSEIVPFIRNEREQREIEDLLRSQHYLSFDDSDWTMVLKLQGILQKKAGTFATVPDLILAAICIRHRVRLFTLDRHFQVIARYSDLQLL